MKDSNERKYKKFLSKRQIAELQKILSGLDLHEITSLSNDPDVQDFITKIK